MKKKLARIKTIWWTFWGIEETDMENAVSIRRTDKISIWYGCFITSLITVGICTLIVTVNYMLSSCQSRQDTEDAMKMIASYIIAATDDEYSEISKNIRYDLVSSEFASDIENLIQYIPNTAEICWTHKPDWTAQALLVSINTGYVYDLDLYAKGESPNDVSDVQNSSRMIFGYDEISETDVQVQKEPGRNMGKAAISMGNSTISLLKMKTNFCDDCIRDILYTVENENLKGFVIFDVENRYFYPVTDGNIQIGNYNLEISHFGSQYEIEIEYITG